MSFGLNVSGVPRCIHRAVTDTPTAAEAFVTYPAITVRLRINTDVAVRMYFTLEDFENDENYWTISPAFTDAGIFSEPMEDRGAWFRCDAASGTSTLQIMTLSRA